METRLSLSPRFSQFAPVAAPARVGRKTIFLVHSAPMDSSLVKAALTERGHHVIHADSIEIAAALWESLTLAVDMFLADICLGKHPGIERLVQRMQAENPRLRVLLANDLDQAPALLLSQKYPQQLVTVVENCLA